MSWQPAIPAGWALTSLGEVCDVVGGATPDTKNPELWGDDVAWVTPADLAKHAGKFIDRGARGLSHKGFDSCGAQMLPAGTVVYSSRAPIGHIAVAAEPMATNQGCKSAVPPAGVDSDYLYWYLTWATPEIRKLGSGTTFAEVSGKVMKTVPLLLPGAGEQRRVVDVLELNRELLTKLQQDIRAVRIKLSALRAATTVRALTGQLYAGSGDAGAELVQIQASRTGGRRPPVPPVAPTTATLPPGWVWASVSQLAATIEYGTSRKAHVDRRDDSDVPVLRMGNIQDGELDFSTLKFVPGDIDELPGLLLEDGDLLFNRTNSAELVGKSAVFHSPEQRYTFASYLIRCRFLPGVRADWVSLAINSPIGRAYIRSVASQQVGQANVNGTKLAAMPIPLPPLAVQDQILAELSRVVATVKRTQADLAVLSARCDSFWQSLLAQAFAGALTAPVLEEEPAELLLKRLVEERAAAPTARRRRGRTVSATRTTTPAAPVEESA